MGEIWRKTMHLLRAQPILWAPVLLADLAGFLLDRLRQWTQREIIYWLVMKKTSVFGNERSLTGSIQANATKTALLAGPVLWGSYLLRICFYSIALLLIVGLLRQIYQLQGPNLSKAGSLLRGLAAKILMFSSKILLIYACFGALGALLTYPGLRFTHQLILGVNSLYFVFVLISTVFTAYLVTPFALSLLNSFATVRPSTQDIGRARAFVMAAVFFSTFLGYLLPSAYPTRFIVASLHNGSAVMIANQVVSLIVAVPYIPAFVALAVITLKEQVDGPPEGQGNLTVEPEDA